MLFSRCKNRGQHQQKVLKPDQLKISKVVPLFKSGDKTCIDNNYRSISLLSIFAKLIEKLMSIRHIKHLEKHNILSKDQFGFKKSCSAEDVVIKARFIKQLRI